ncbi:MAG: SPOR domain-containing protein [Pyrinomonadaceae bacterium]
MKVICSNCRTMNLLPETMADAPISRMTCARCGNVMDLPVESPVVESPEVNAPMPELQMESAPVAAATVASNLAATVPLDMEPAPSFEERVSSDVAAQETIPKEAVATGAEEAYESDYEVPVIPPDRTGNILKYLSFLLIFVAIIVAALFFAWPYVRDYLGQGSNAATNPNSAAPAPANSNTIAGTNRPVATPTASPSSNANQTNSSNVNNANIGAPANTNNANAKNANGSNLNANAANRNDASTDNSNRAKPAPPVAAPPVSSGSGNITIQVGSHPNPESANQQVARLQSQGIAARMVRAEIPGRGTYYRVQVGRFASQDEANRYAAQLRSKGISQIYITQVSQ